ncbi:TPA: hypothetical protein ACPZQ4_000023 [Yersinia enterocolitica]|nr:hypothetical protein [Yersinia enterocolitica]
MLSKEQINSAMLSSLEGFSFSVVDSLEFELSRKLTASEQQEVFVIVERVVLDSTSLREQLAELKKQEPIGQVIFGSYGSDGIREASIVCLHDQADWDNFQDGTLLYLEAKPADD